MHSSTRKFLLTLPSGKTMVLWVMLRPKENVEILPKGPLPLPDPDPPSCQNNHFQPESTMPHCGKNVSERRQDPNIVFLALASWALKRQLETIQIVVALPKKPKDVVLVRCSSLFSSRLCRYYIGYRYLKTTCDYKTSNPFI
jgi:hypothetical protein